MLLTYLTLLALFADVDEHRVAMCSHLYIAAAAAAAAAACRVGNGLEMVEHTDHGGGSSPDYTNTTLIDAMVTFIAAFGEQYNGDSRLGYVLLACSSLGQCNLPAQHTARHGTSLRRTSRHGTTQ